MCKLALWSDQALAQSDTPTSNQWASVDLEVGFTHFQETHPAFNLAASAGWGPVSVNAIAAAVDNDPEIVLASMRYTGDGWYLDAGRIGVSLGLVPPIYSASEPLASQPDIYPRVQRAILRAIGLPDVGAALTLVDGRWKYTARAYAPVTADLSDVLFIVPEQFDQIRAAGPLTPGICTFCRLLDDLIGVDIEQAISMRMNIDTQQKLGNIYGAGIEYSGNGTTFVADYGHLIVQDEGIDVGFVSIARDWQYASASIQYGDIGIARTYGVTLVIPTELVTGYAHAFRYDGEVLSEEYGGGIVLGLGRLSIRGGYDYVTLGDSVSQGPEIAASWRF